MNFLTCYAPISSSAATIIIDEVVGTEKGALAEHHGHQVYALIIAAFQEGKSTILSFKNREKLSWSFISAAIGRLYDSFPEEQIQANLRLVDIEPDRVAFIDEVIQTRKDYAKNPEKFKNPMSDEELEEMQRKNTHNSALQVAGIFRDDPQFDEMLEYIAAYRREVDAEDAGK